MSNHNLPPLPDPNHNVHPVEDVDKQFTQLPEHLNLSPDRPVPINGTEPLDESPRLDYEQEKQLNKLATSIHQAAAQRLGFRQYDAVSGKRSKEMDYWEGAGPREVQEIDKRTKEGRVDKDGKKVMRILPPVPSKKEALAEELAEMMRENPRFGDMIEAQIKRDIEHLDGGEKYMGTTARELLAQRQANLRAAEGRVKNAHIAHEAEKQTFPDEPIFKKPVKPEEPGDPPAASASSAEKEAYDNKVLAYKKWEKATENYKESRKAYLSPHNRIGERLGIKALQEIKPSQKRRAALIAKRGEIKKAENADVDRHHAYAREAIITEAYARPGVAEAQHFVDESEARVACLQEVYALARQKVNTSEMLREAHDEQEILTDANDTLERMFTDYTDSMEYSEEDAKNISEKLEELFIYVSSIDDEIGNTPANSSAIPELMALREEVLSNYIQIRYKREHLQILSSAAKGDNTEGRHPVHFTPDKSIRITDGYAVAIYPDGSYIYEIAPGVYDKRLNTSGQVWTPPVEPPVAAPNINPATSLEDLVDYQYSSLEGWFMSPDDKQLAIEAEAYAAAVEANIHAQAPETGDPLIEDGMIATYWKLFIRKELGHHNGVDDSEIAIGTKGQVTYNGELGGLYSTWTLHPDGSSVMHQKNIDGSVDYVYFDPRGNRY